MSTITAVLPASAVPAYERGNKAFCDENYALAVNEYTDAIKSAPRYAILYSNRAAAYIRLDQLPKALQDLVTVTNIDEMWAEGWVRFADVFAIVGEREPNPEGVSIIYRGVVEAYEIANGLLKMEGDNTVNEQKLVEAKLKGIRERISQL